MNNNQLTLDETLSRIKSLNTNIKELHEKIESKNRILSSLKEQQQDAVQSYENLQEEYRTRWRTDSIDYSNASYYQKQDYKELRKAAQQISSYDAEVPECQRELQEMQNNLSRLEGFLNTHKENASSKIKDALLAEKERISPQVTKLSGNIKPENGLFTQEQISTIDKNNKLTLKNVPLIISKYNAVIELINSLNQNSSELENIFIKNKEALNSRTLGGNKLFSKSFPPTSHKLVEIIESNLKIIKAADNALGKAPLSPPSPLRR